MRITILLIVLTLCIGGVAQQAAKTPEPRVPASNPQFNALKTLAGEWETKTPDGQVATENYRVVSGGSAIILDQKVPGESNMITMFHPNGQLTVATHYCSMGNQPRMVATPSSDTKTIHFTFKDITNDDGKSGSMRNLTIHLLDNDHHVQDWTWRGPDGKEQTESFRYTRVSSAAPGQ